MNKLGTALTIAAAVASSGGSVGVAQANDGAPPPNEGPSLKGCREDQRCWNWAAMGNGQRGARLTDGRKVVVEWRQWTRLRDGGKIDWKRTPHLKGDWWNPPVFEGD